MKDHEIRELVNQLRDVAIKYHGAGQLREQIARTVRAAMLQAQSDDDGEPTDDERIMAIEGIHNCERCGDEGWVVGEMGITRCACGQAGNSPVIPEGYVMVPKEPTAQMYDAGDRQMTTKQVWDAMLAVAPQLPGSEPATVPGKWIPVSERMPEGSEEVLCAKEFDGPGDWRRKVGYLLAGKWTVYGASWTPTHWMPLPAAPQGVK
ncbi:DUF551 domain-containing protein [Klebsiella michiganensis]|nr:DUF551 domain-containing protein [Klebsiella michiganensis]